MSPKTVDILKWVATISFFVAAFLISSNIEISKYGFIIFMIGHGIYAGVFTYLKDWSMAVHGWVFLLLDIYGIIRWFL